MNASNFSARRAMATCRLHHDALMCQVRTFAGSKKQSQRTLSRKEKRRQNRELKRNQRSKDTETSTSEARQESSAWKHRLDWFMPRPRMPGGSSNFEKEEIISIAKRLPFFLVLAGLVTYEDSTPLKLDRAFGPSMLPTIHPLGDVFLRVTGAWQRALGFKMDYQVGDVVAISNSSGRGLNCKRIVGVAGDKVLRYGQFVDMYKVRSDLGILPPRQQAGYNLSWDDSLISAGVENDIDRTITVPESHVWVEGDNPLFSVDSRHYGPVPVEAIRGRLLMRIWPLWRRKGVRPSPVLMARDRPVPLALDEALAVHRYNLYKQSVPGVDEKPEWR